MEGNNLQIVFVIDESGSMSGTESDVTGGFNGFIRKQKLEKQGKILVSVYKFNDKIKPQVLNSDIEKVPNLDAKNYAPGGSTALLDAIGRGILETDEFINASANPKPDKVLMVIITDGYENSSRKFSKSDIAGMIATYEQQMNWDFIYMGADLENFADADTLGLTYKTNFSKNDIHQVFDHISEESINFRKQMYLKNSKLMAEKIVEKTKKKK